MNHDAELSIVIPAYNEVGRLPESLKIIDQFCKDRLHHAYEILVVDDGSRDATSEAVRSAQKNIAHLRLISYSPNRGKGYAIKRGVDESAGMYIVFMDADLSTPIEELPRLLEALSKNIPVVIGTRKNPEAEIIQRQPVWRESMGKVFTRLSNIILGLKVSDFTCGFKGFSAEAARRLFRMQTIDGWAFDSEILYLANRLGYQVQEIPVRWKNSPETRVRVVQDTVKTIISLIRIRLQGLTGKYDLSP